MDIRRILGLPELLDVKKVVCVQPHPDDNEVGAHITHPVDHAPVA